MKNKNDVTKEVVASLKAASIDRKSPFLEALVRDLSKPRRVRREVNLDRIEKFAEAKGIVVVPGVVLGEGEIKKKVEVFAFRFSGKAREKIEKAGGKAIDISELGKENPAGKGVKILG